MPSGAWLCQTRNHSPIIDAIGEILSDIDFSIRIRDLVDNLHTFSHLLFRHNAEVTGAGAPAEGTKSGTLLASG